MNEKNNTLPYSTRDRKLPEIELSNQDEESLKQEVHSRREKDIRGSLQIKKYLKTEAELTPYLGEVYCYLQSRSICENYCPKKVLSCPKEKKGEAVSLSFNPTTKKVTLVRTPCPLREKEREDFDRISPCYLPSKSRTLSALQSFRSDREKLSKRQDSALAIASFRKKIGLLRSQESVRKGLIFSSQISVKVPNDLLRALCFIGAKSGFSCSYLNRKDFTESICSFNGYEVEYREWDLNKAVNSDLLFLEGFDQIPGYVDKKTISKVFLSLFAGRDKAHKLTYRSVENGSAFSKVSSLLKGNINLEAIKTHRKNILASYEIKDIDIR